MRAKVLIGLVLMLFAGVAFAQEQTSGTLEGIIIADDTGAPIEGVVITASGPQGVQTTVTDNAGRYNIRGLVSGNYTVKAEASGYATIIQEDVRVGIGRRTQLPFRLPAGQVETITVTSEAPAVDMKSTAVDTNIVIDDFAPYVPLGRNIVSTFAIAPGVSDGGTIGAANQSISGSSGLENAYFIDGVNITNGGFGALGSYSIVYGSLGTGVTYDFLEEVQVKTGGFEAEFGQAGGGVVNSVVKSGTNDFGFDVSWYEEPTSFEGSRGDRLDSPNIANTIDTMSRDISITAGGAILQDKLFYFAAFNQVSIEQDFKLTSGDAATLYDLDGDLVFDDSFAVGETISGGRTPDSVTRKRTWDNYAAKLAWYLNPSHKIEFTAFGDPAEGDVGPQNPTQFLRNLTEVAVIPDPSTGATGLDYGGDQLSLRYQGVWTTNFFTEVLFATKENVFTEFGPGTDFRSFFDLTTNTTFGGAGFYEDKLDKSTQWSIKNTHIFGPVELSYGYQFDDMEFADPSHRSGPSFTSYFPQLVEGVELGDGTIGVGLVGDGTLGSSYTPLQSSTGAAVDIDVCPEGVGTCYNVTRTAFEPLDAVTTNEETNLFAQVTWEVTPSVVVKAGLRWTEQKLQGSGTFTMPFSTLSSGLPTGIGSTEFNAKTYTFDSEIAPRFGVTWDVLSDGKHKLFANYGEYYQRVPSDLAVRQFSNEVGVEGELFTDAGLSNPFNNSNCWIDTTADGIYDTEVDCHISESTTGAQPGVILDGTVDPDGDPDVGNNPATKLPYTKEILAGYAFEINDYTSMEVRYISRELGRVLEDVQFASNEQTWNEFWGADLFPVYNEEFFSGHGTGAFGAYVLANPGGNINTTMFPLPVRDYEALEVVFNRRFNNGWMAYANYRWAQLDGNYEGSYRNDNGQSDPFITSLFDFPAASAVDGSFVISDTLAGQYTLGPLNTDRTHIVNAFLSKRFENGLNIGGRGTIATGQPRFPLFAHPTYRNAGEIPGTNPVYWYWIAVDGSLGIDGSAMYTDPSSELTNDDIPDADYDGDGLVDEALGIISGPRLFSYDIVKRDHFGRNPTTMTFDLHVSYDVKLRDRNSSLTLMFDAFNIFNDNAALTFDNNIETRPGNPNPDYLKANLYQTPRNIRLGAKFTW